MYFARPLRDSKGRFVPGNKSKGGRPKTIKPEFKQALEDATPGVIQRVIQMALEGDLMACKLILDRSYPIKNVLHEELEQEIIELQAEIDHMKKLRAV